MIEININEIKNNINSLQTLIEQYEEIKLNIFNNLKDVCINWQDGNSLVFDNKIFLEKQETELLIETIKAKKEVFNFIYEKYSDIGRKIRCNLNNKTTLLNTIDNCYNQAINILNEFNKIDRSFYYTELNSIQNQKEKIITVKNKISIIKTKTSKLYSKIEIIEEEVKKKIKELEEIKINSFDYIES